MKKKTILMAGTLLVLSAAVIVALYLNRQHRQRNLENAVTSVDSAKVSSGLAQTSGNDTDIPMVYVEGGTFTMGCTSEQGDECDDDEKPTHKVTLSSYYIGRTEVTQAQWKAVMGSNPSDIKGDSWPVESVDFKEVIAFIRKLNAKTGKNYRLPTEAEWEFAARGGNQSKGYKYSGSDTADIVAWYGDNSSNKTHPVGTKAPNELGIYDMSGNVSEWCSDWYGYYSSFPQTNPRGGDFKFQRVYRGGCMDDVTSCVRVSYRDKISPVANPYYLGFRLACSSTKNNVKEEIDDEEPLEFLSGKDEIAREFINIVKQGKYALSEHVSYPLEREYPVPPVRNKQEFLKRYDEIFDYVLIEKIINSDIQNDWTSQRWENIFFADKCDSFQPSFHFYNVDCGLLRLGKIRTKSGEGTELWGRHGGPSIQTAKEIGIREVVLTEKAKNKRKALIEAERKQLYNSLQQFIKPECMLETPEHLIRIDKIDESDGDFVYDDPMGHRLSGIYRLALWENGESISNKPFLILNGIKLYRGSMMITEYIFKDKDLEYRITAGVKFGRNSELSFGVYKNDTIIGKGYYASGYNEAEEWYEGGVKQVEGNIKMVYWSERNKK